MRISSLLLVTVLLASGCSNFEYYSQAVGGHLDIMNRREPVAEILADPASSPELRRRLEDSQLMRDFASTELALPRNDSYRSYVDLNRPYVVWNVFATPELSLTPEEWCFLIIGCVSYRGYFAEADAHTMAEQLAAEGLDVYVGGATAYSTLGWFDDPLTTPMLNRGDMGLAGLMFHELAHQQLYVKGDSAFNEAFASTVEEMGMRRWLEATGPENLPLYERRLAIKKGFLALVARTRDALGELYSGSLTDETKRIRKMEIVAGMRADYAGLKASWDGYSGYDRWFSGEINNAKLAAVAIYRELVPEFMRWFAACDGDFARFYSAMAIIAELELDRRQEVLRGPASC